MIAVGAGEDMVTSESIYHSDHSDQRDNVSMVELAHDDMHVL